MIKKVFKSIIVTLLTIEARLVLKKYQPKIIAITGSVGKTSAKDAIYTALASTVHIRKSQKTFNSDIGVPLTILGLPNAWSNIIEWMRNIIDGLFVALLPHKYPEALILEMGLDHPGDIKRMTSWISPDVVVLTRYPDVPVHVEFFDSPEAVIKEKQYLPHALKKNGVLVLNGDDKIMSQQAMPDVKKITYGFGKDNDVQATSPAYTYSKEKLIGTHFKVTYQNTTVPVAIKGAIGRQHVYPILAAFAVGINQGLGLETLEDLLREHQSPQSRMKLIDGINESTIIDDSYNSSPIAAHEALEALKKVKTEGKKIAVLGDMLELGSYSSDAHKEMGKEAAESTDVLITVGIRSRMAAESANKAHMKKRAIYECEDWISASAILQDLIEPGDVVLVKGSQSIRLERVVERIMARPEQAKKLLVRQDKEWRSRP